jgi:hypothetical protein
MSRSRVGPHATAFVGFLLAACLTLAALLPAYYQHGISLASNAQNLWFNIPAIAAWLGVGILLLFRRSAWLAVGLGISVTALWAPNYARDIATVIGGVHPGGGFWLGIAGLAAALVGTIALLAMAFGTSGGSFSTARPAPLLMILGGGIGAAYLVGDAMPWQRAVVHATVNGSPVTLHTDCCTLLQQHGWTLTSDLVIVTLAVVLPALAACWRPNLLGLGLTLGVAFGLAGSALGGIASLTTTPSPASLGITAAQVTTDAVRTTTEGLPGLWISSAAVALLICVAVSRVLAPERSSSRRP